MGINERELSLTITDEDAGERLDRFLARRLAGSGLSRSRIAAAVEEDLILVDGRPTSKSHRLRPGEIVAVSDAALAEPEPCDPLTPREHSGVRVLHIDDDIVVVDKPPGLVVHPAHGHPDDTLLNALAARGISLAVVADPARPGVVHRLDRDTSGVLVLARNRPAHLHLSRQFARHNAERLYEALCYGVPQPPAGTIDEPLGRHPGDRKRFAVVTGGREAVTHYRVLERLHNSSLVECRLETGRTHQIRVHLAHRGHPLLGDPVYASRSSERFSRGLPLVGQALHAKALGFVHPSSGVTLSFATAPPSGFQETLTLLRAPRD